VNRPVSSAQEAVRRLATLREEIEQVDRQIIDLVVHRARLAREAGDV
jgi:chorismate mutase